jgi:hypothetical protein
MAPHVHILVEGDAPAPLARSLRRFGVPHRLIDVDSTDEDATPDLSDWGPRAGIVACVASGDAAERLCRHFADHGIVVLHLGDTANDTLGAAATAGTLGGLLDRMAMAAAPAA